MCDEGDSARTRRVREAYDVALQTYMRGSSAGAAAGAIVRPEGLPRTLPHTLHGHHYAIDRQLGVGAYGTVYAGHSLVSQRRVAIKVESASERYKQLKIETETLLWLEDHACADIIPIVACKGVTEGGHFLYTVMDRLGDNLLNLLTRAGGRFSVGTVLRVAYQMVCILERVHQACIMHRDIKPENFCVQYNDPHKICIIDFGMSKAYADPETGRHIPPASGHPFMGTPRYVSLNCHSGHQLSRRDDLISVGYVCVYMATGSLPWRSVEGELHTSAGRDNPMMVYDKIARVKRDTLRSMNDQRIPNTIHHLINHGYSLAFDAAPDYDALKSRLLSELQEYGGVDAPFDWELPG